MAREKKNVHKVEMTEGKRNIIQMLLQEYDIESAQDIQEALKDLLGRTDGSRTGMPYAPFSNFPAMCERSYIPLIPMSL